METQKNDEKNIVLEMKRLLGRMMVQVDYMYRNDREMSRLDLDIMMERTRDFYDLLCDYQSDNVEKVEADHHMPDVEINEGGELINHDDFVEDKRDEEDKEDNEDKKDNEEKLEEHPVGAIHVLPVDEDNENVVDENDIDENDVEEEKDEDDEEDWEDEEDEMLQYIPIEEKQEILVETTEPEEVEDNSLAARLQRMPIKNIRSALGINDKMMIINDLFKGSVERCNKSIDALNDFPTLSGAKVYLSELQIELQWDVESQAYKMLNDLVERRFL